MHSVLTMEKIRVFKCFGLRNYLNPNIPLMLMSFQNIRRVEKAQHYLDTALGKARTRKGKKLRGDHFQNAKTKDLEKINVIRDNLKTKLKEIVNGFPSMNNLSEFYEELSKLTLDVDKLRISLSKVNNAQKKIAELTQEYRGKLIKADHLVPLTQAKKSFIGRVSSIITRLDKTFDFLEQTRKQLDKFPVIKQGLFTVCIAGFPNVGKSTLLAKITTSKPEIDTYAFTTKRLNLGYSVIKEEKIQFIDTPGTLARTEKMNDIERQAYLAIKYSADLIIYIFDLSYTYPIEDQENLLENLKRFRKPIIFYLSKTDVIDKNIVDDFKKKINVCVNVNQLKKTIIENME